MRSHVLTFGKPPSFNELVARVTTNMNVECELRMHGRYDMGDNRLIYVKLPLGSKDEWFCISHMLASLGSRVPR
jgi:hypothetical protein